MATSKIKAEGLFTRSISLSWTLSGSSASNFDIKTLIDNDLPQGYRCLGTVGYDTGQNQQLVSRCQYEGSISFTMRNIATEERSGTATIRYLCAPK